LEGRDGSRGKCEGGGRKGWEGEGRCRSWASKVRGRKASDGERERRSEGVSVV